MKSLKYKIVKRWLPEEFDWQDVHGEWHKTPNPEPEVQILAGIWRQGEGELIHSVMSASEFRRLTGRIIYGGNIEKRGVIEWIMNDELYDIIKPRFDRSTQTPSQARAKAIAKSKVDKIEELRQGRLHVLEGAKCRIRKKS